MQTASTHEHCHQVKVMADPSFPRCETQYCIITLLLALYIYISVLRFSLRVRDFPLALAGVTEDKIAGYGNTGIARSIGLGLLA